MVDLLFYSIFTLLSLFVGFLCLVLIAFSSFAIISLGKKIRIHHEYEGWIEKLAPRFPDWHHVTSRDFFCGSFTVFYQSCVCYAFVHVY